LLKGKSYSELSEADQNKVKAYHIEGYQQSAEYQKYRESEKFNPNVEREVRDRFGLRPWKQPMAMQSTDTNEPRTARKFQPEQETPPSFSQRIGGGFSAFRNNASGRLSSFRKSASNADTRNAMVKKALSPTNQIRYAGKAKGVVVNKGRVGAGAAGKAAFSALGKINPEAAIAAKALGNKGIGIAGAAGLTTKGFGFAPGKAAASANALSKKASAVTKAARGALVQKYGIKAIFKPRFWILLFTGIATKHPTIVAITLLISSFILMGYTFGAISAIYAFDFIRDSVCLVPNFFLTMGNAVWFAAHGILFLGLSGALEVINGIIFFATGPLVKAINFLLSPFIDTKVIQPLTPPVVGKDLGISQWPYESFSYLAPADLTIKTGTDGGIDYWATFCGMWNFKWIRAGAPLYEKDANGNIIYTKIVGQMGANLTEPTLNPDSLADGFWSKTYNQKDRTIGYMFDTGGKANEWYDHLADIPTILWNGLTGWLGHFTNPTPDPQHPPPAGLPSYLDWLWNFLMQEIKT